LYVVLISVVDITSLLTSSCFVY